MDFDAPVFPVDALSPAAQKLVGPGAPGPARMMAARGLAPLTPKDLISALAALTVDADESIRKAAEATLVGLPERILLAALGERLHAAVLHRMAERFFGVSRYAELIILNPGVADETIDYLAQRCKERELEIIAANENRLVRFPRIIESLYMNPQTRMSTVDRVIEFAVRSGLELHGIPAFKEAQAAILGIREEAPLIVPPPPPPRAAPPPPAQAAPPPPPAEPAPRPVAAPTPVAPVVLAGEDLLSAEQRTVLAEDRGEEEASADAEIQPRASIQVLLGQMTTSQRIRWACIGNREVRTHLMRDSNKLVAAAAIKNPRVTEQEVMAIALSRSVNDEVIRVIASTKEWTKSYRVRLNLVNNPKCPLPAAMTFLRTLRASDIRALAKNKNVPSVLAQTARRMASEMK
jgi:hypothetical protein